MFQTGPNHQLSRAKVKQNDAQTNRSMTNGAKTSNNNKKEKKTKQKRTHTHVEQKRNNAAVLRIR